MYTQSYLLHFTFYPQLEPPCYTRGNILEMSVMAHDAEPAIQESSKDRKLE